MWLGHFVSSVQCSLGVLHRAAVLHWLSSERTMVSIHGALAGLGQTPVAYVVSQRALLFEDYSGADGSLGAFE